MELYIFFLVFILFTIFLYTYKNTKKWANNLEITKVTPLTVIFSIIFIGASAVPILGVSGLTYKLGMSGMWTALITASSGYVPILFLGKKFVDIANHYKAQNFIDLLACRYKSVILGVISGVVGIMLMFLLTVIQFVGIKYLTEITTNSSSSLPFLIYITLIIILFTVVEKKSFNVLNVVLGLIVFLISCVLILLIINAGGGINNIKDQIYNMNPQYFSPLGPETYKMSYLFIFSYWIYLGFGVLGVPIVSFRTVQYSPWLKTALLGGTVIIFIMTFNMACIGFLSIPLLKNVSCADKIFPLVAGMLTSPFISNCILFVLLLSLVGTIKLQLNSISSIVNFLTSKIYNYKEKEKFALKKIGIIIYLITASYFAINYTLNNLFNIMLLSFGGLASAFTWAIIFAPFTYKFVNKGAAITSIIFGIMLFSLIYNSETYWRSLFYPAALPVVLGLFVYILSGYLYYFFTRVLFKILS